MAAGKMRLATFEAADVVMIETAVNKWLGQNSSYVIHGISFQYGNKVVAMIVYSANSDQ
jgi:hypothetical protein